MSIDDPFLAPLEGHAKAIGYACINWAWLELIAETFLMHLLTMHVTDPVGHCVMVNSDIRSKLAMIKSIGFLKRPSDDWFNRLETLVNITRFGQIETELSMTFGAPIGTARLREPNRSRRSSSLKRDNDPS